MTQLQHNLDSRHSDLVASPAVRTSSFVTIMAMVCGAKYNAHKPPTP